MCPHGQGKKFDKQKADMRVQGEEGKTRSW